MLKKCDFAVSSTTFASSIGRNIDIQLLRWKEPEIEELLSELSSGEEFTEFNEDWFDVKPEQTLGELADHNLELMLRLVENK